MTENEENIEKKSNENIKTRIKFISEIILMITVGFLVIFPLVVFVSNFLL
ncbi:MAG: hypothetical protein ACTSPA_11255 [Promethearchaeota archaeon]